jgi:hypothetical protein
MLQTVTPGTGHNFTPRAPRPAFRGRVIHDVGGAGPIYSAVRAPDGRLYFSDELRHRVVVEEPSGYRWSFGTIGDGPGELRHPRGLALHPGDSPSSHRLFVCDAWNHRIQVFDGDGAPRTAFGAPGRGDGQLDTPSDIVLVHPVFEGDERAEPGAEPWLAVADRGNNRVQVFDLAGVFVGAVDGRQAGVPMHPAAAAAGWPFFRLGAHPVLWCPVRLEWKPPHLEIVSADRESTQVHLALALLPPLGEWIRSASHDELVAAHRELIVESRLPLLPLDVAAAIEARLEALSASSGEERAAQADRASADGRSAA